MPRAALLLAVLSLAPSLAGPAAAQEPWETQERWETWREPGAGYALDVPDHLFATRVKGIAGGVTYASRSGDARLQAFSFPAEGGARGGAEAALRGWVAMRPDRDHTYTRAGPGWFVASGFELDGRVFYERFERGGGLWSGFSLVYAEARRGDVDHTIERIADSLTPAR